MKYKVRVYIADIEIDADTKDEAENKAMDIIDDELFSSHVEYADARQAFDYAEQDLLSERKDENYGTAPS